MPSSSPVPFWIARLMLSAGMFTDLAFSIAVRRRGFELGSPPARRAAIDISRMILVKILPRLASSAPFLCLMDAHLECPDIGSLLQTAWRMRVYHPPEQQKSPDAGRRGFGSGKRKSRQRPTLPPGYPGSTIGAGGLNGRVRNGNGCDPSAMVTGMKLVNGSNGSDNREQIPGSSE